MVDDAEVAELFGEEFEIFGGFGGVASVRLGIFERLFEVGEDVAGEGSFFLVRKLIGFPILEAVSEFLRKVGATRREFF